MPDSIRPQYEDEEDEQDTFSAFLREHPTLEKLAVGVAKTLFNVARSAGDCAREYQSSNEQLSQATRPRNNSFNKHLWESRKREREWERQREWDWWATKQQFDEESGFDDDEGEEDYE